MVVLIPAFEPDQRLIDLIRSILAEAPAMQIVIVNDGSAPEYDPIFEAAAALGCHIVAHISNLGKGRALKRGFAHIVDRFPGTDVVTADADGQHAVPDILMVTGQLQGRHNTIILGTRGFDEHARVPLRSRVGNKLTRLIFSKATGVELDDTQTGLRGYPSGLLDWLQQIPGERFEYELIVLLRAVEMGYQLLQAPIATIYVGSNRSSHFRPLRDSARIYAPLLRFSLSSLAAFLLDFALLLILEASTGSLLFSVIAARAVSSVFNYLTNRHLVFVRGRDTSILRSAGGYFSLVVILMIVNYGMMHFIHERVGLGLVPAKVMTESLLFAVSYQIQRRVIFPGTSEQRVEDRADRAPPTKSSSHL